jgi:hypothetical protein
VGRKGIQKHGRQGLKPLTQHGWCAFKGGKVQACSGKAPSDCLWLWLGERGAEVGCVTT